MNEYTNDLADSLPSADPLAVLAPLTEAPLIEPDEETETVTAEDGTQPLQPEQTVEIPR